MLVLWSCQDFQEEEIGELYLTKEKTITSFSDSNGETFFFVKITGMANAGDSYIFIDDARSAAYSTDKDFKNYKVITTTGDGPGEFLSIGNISNINSVNQHFIINDLRYDKLVILDEKQNFNSELKLERNLDPRNNSIVFDGDKIIFVTATLRNKTNIEYVFINYTSKKIDTFQIPGTEDIPGERFSTFQLNDKYVFIAKHSYPSYLITSKNGELLKNGDLLKYPLLSENVSIASEKLKSLGVPASIVLFEHIFSSENKIFILSNNLFEDGNFRTNQILELELVKGNSLDIKKVYHLSEDDDYRAILIDGNKIIASNKRTGYLDIYSLPD